jgi:hypothetical protein
VIALDHVSIALEFLKSRHLLLFSSLQLLFLLNILLLNNGGELRLELLVVIALSMGLMSLYSLLCSLDSFLLDFLINFLSVI